MDARDGAWRARQDAGRRTRRTHATTGSGFTMIEALEDRRLLSIADPAGASPVVIDLMVVYTPAAAANTGGVNIHTQIDQAIADTNQVLENSKAGFSVRLVHAGMINYMESGLLSQDLTRLALTNDGFMDEVHALRDAYAADLVTMLVSTGDLAGLAYQVLDVNDPYNVDRAFSVVVARYATAPDYTFPHELGHLLGAGHDQARNEGPGALPDAYGYRFTANGTLYRDIMSYEPGIRIPYFSTPYVMYQGAPIGQAGVADNVKAMRWVAASVAGYRGERLPAAVDFSAAPTAVLAGQPVTLTATVGSGLVGFAPPGGTVSFWEEGDLLGDALIEANGMARLVVLGTTPGDHVVVARYDGDAAYAQAWSQTLVVSVTPLDRPQVTLSAWPPNPIAGQAVTFAVVVAPPPGAPEMPTGHVSLWDGETWIGAAALDATGAAALAITNLPRGARFISAFYEGDSFLLPASSETLPLTVLPASPPRGTANIKGNQLIGWVIDPNAGTKSIQVHVRIDGALRGRIVVPAAGSKRTFKWALPQMRVGTRSVEVWAVDHPTKQPVLLVRRTVQNGQALFDARYYMATYAEANAAVAAGTFTSAWDHYVQVGQAKRWSPSATFDERFYLTKHRDVLKAVKAGKYRSGFEHYIMAGQAEGRQTRR